MVAVVGPALGNKLLSSFTILEMFAVVFPLALVAVAFGRGVLYEFMQIMAWIGGVGVAEAVFPVTRPYVEQAFAGSLFGDFIAILFVALPIALLASLLSGAVTKEVNASKLGLMNKGLGAAFGLLRGAVIVWLAVGLMSWSFFRSAAQAYDAIDHGARSASVTMPKGDVPLADIMCDRVEPPALNLVRRLQSVETSMSPVIHEIWRYNDKPEDFKILNMMRMVSVSICAK